MVRYPYYYPQFRCSAQDCGDNCCIGWEIDVDAASLERYEQVQGAFGKRLRDAITKSPEGMPCFRQDADGRCVFLNAQNLCDLILTLGEDALCQICTDHPRFYHWFGDVTECGVGLCCEAAAKLILQPAPHPYCIGALPKPDDALEDFLLRQREVLFAIVQSALPFSAMMDTLYSKAEQMQEEMDAILCGFPICGEPLEPVSWSAAFWEPERLQALFSYLLTMEMQNPLWRKTLWYLQENLPKLLAQQASFFEKYPQVFSEYRSLLLYFLYRHLPDALEEGSLLAKVRFALSAVSLIQLLDLACFAETGTLTQTQQIDICKLLSKEMEYNAENTRMLGEFSIFA